MLFVTFYYGKVFKLILFINCMKVKRVSEVVGSKVYTDSGDYFGEIEEVNLLDNKIDGWRIKVNPEAVSMIGGARGVIVPHQFVKAIGDIFLINNAALPSPNLGMDNEEVPEELI
jgi:sporulation protein YlmC with PRC-barrel domain